MLEVHAVGGRAEIEMQVDVDVVFARQFENAVDLAGQIAIDIGRAANGAAAAIERLDHQFVGAGIVEQPFLRKNAICRSIAQAYSLISGSTPSRLRRPTPGSTSRCVRM